MTESDLYPTPYGQRPADQELATNLLEPGWAGHLRTVEVRYVREVLQKKQPAPAGLRRGKLRSWWGLTGQGVASEAAIRHVAMWGDPDDVERNRRQVKEAKAPEPVVFRIEAPVARATAKKTRHRDGETTPMVTELPRNPTAPHHPPITAETIPTPHTATKNR